MDRQIKDLGRGLALAGWWFIFLFGGAGELTWARGWVCTVLYLGAFLALRTILGKRNPELLEQRQRAIRTDTKPFDKWFLRLFLPLTILQPLIAGLDERFNPAAALPFSLVYPGIALFALSAIVILWVLLKNPHAESSVRIHKDRAHAVVASGPYRFVRHPMYVGLVLLHVSLALTLGSVWNLALAALIAVLFLWRTALEDQTLRRELPGYEQYATVTRYRLVPGIW